MASYEDAIAGAHKSLNDPGRVRYPDVDTLPYACDAVREIAIHKPELFITTGPVACAANTTEQTVAGVGLYVLDVLGVVGGGAVTKADLDTLRRARPSWRTEAAGPAKHWFPLTNDQTKRPQAGFLIYPQAPQSQVLTVQYVRDPYALALPGKLDVMPIPDQLLPAVESYIVFRAEMMDDEHVVTQRAQAAYQNFATIVGIAKEQRRTIVQEGRPQ